MTQRPNSQAVASAPALQRSRRLPARVPEHPEPVRVARRGQTLQAAGPYPPVGPGDPMIMPRPGIIFAITEARAGVSAIGVRS